MKKVLLTSALIAAVGTAATAQGIAPVATAPTTNVVVGTATPDIDPSLLVVGVGVVFLGLALSSSDGSS
ncbi:hypothetical protein [Gymnodinialimonas sp.]